MVKKAFAVVFVVMGLSGCGFFSKNGQSQELSGTVQDKRTGIYPVKDSRKKYNPIPEPNKYYGQLNVYTDVYNYENTPEEDNFFSTYAKNIAGKRVEQFGVAVTPTLDGVKLPPVILVSYYLDKSSNSWRMSVNERYSSPTILIRLDTKIQFEVSYFAVNATNVSIMQKVTDLVAGYSNLNYGAWVISSISEPQVKAAATQVDDSISNVMSQSITYTTLSGFQPASDGEREVVYQVIASGKNKNLERPLASVKVYTVLSPSLVGRPDETEKSGAPKMDYHVNPLVNIKQSGEREVSLWHVVSEEATLVQFQNAATVSGAVTDFQVSRFVQACNSMRGLLQGKYSLSYYDALSAMSYILKGTQYSGSKELFDSGCLSDKDKKTLAEMGIPLVSTFSSAAVLPPDI